ncbi:WhiB family transcriptional regulator [Gordonia paraffinivorans]|uniref:WhiB family transcriptional regulator n=1 Tax=Gordonia paraffinivorans TaxID=175628 RepID=UPI00144611EA|nr:WhiB family transcriptional regulator [Gordonia paraffinivorans]
MKYRHRNEPGLLPLLAEVLEGTADLSGAACAGRPELFDEAAVGEDVQTARYRHRAAVRICSTCPALDRCRQWADAQKDLGGMVVAGRAPRLRGAQPHSERKNQR